MKVVKQGGDKNLDDTLKQVYQEKKKHREKKRKKKAEEEKKDVEIVTVSIRPSPFHIHYSQNLDEPQPTSQNIKYDQKPSTGKGPISTDLSGEALFATNRKLAEQIGRPLIDSPPRIQPIDYELSGYQAYGRMLGPSSTGRKFEQDHKKEIPKLPTRNTDGDPVSVDDIDINFKKPSQK